jgi:uncharacterized protein YjbJ (UPF0337 family)
MDKDRIEGAAMQVRRTIKQAVGKVMGDTKTEAKGKASKVECAVGGAKDAARDALKRK